MLEWKVVEQYEKCKISFFLVGSEVVGDGVTVTKMICKPSTNDEQDDYH